MTGIHGKFVILLKYRNYYYYFDKFMTSESSDMLILPFTSKTGQSIAQNRQKIF